MDYSENGVPMFNGQNGFKYEKWSIRTKVFLHEQGHYIWVLVVTGYDNSKRAKTVVMSPLWDIITGQRLMMTRVARWML
jgi:hypothetical protein